MSLLPANEPARATPVQVDLVGDASEAVLRTILRNRREKRVHVGVGERDRVEQRRPQPRRDHAELVEDAVVHPQQAVVRPVDLVGVRDPAPRERAALEQAH
jgi:hypothetical protein